MIPRIISSVGYPLPAPGVLCGELDVVPERHARLPRGGLRGRRHLSGEYSGGGADCKVELK